MLLGTAVLQFHVTQMDGVHDLVTDSSIQVCSIPSLAIMQSLRKAWNVQRERIQADSKILMQRKRRSRWSRRRRSGTTTYIEFYLNLDGSLRITYKWKSRLPDQPWPLLLVQFEHGFLLTMSCSNFLHLCKYYYLPSLAAGEEEEEEGFGVPATSLEKETRARLSAASGDTLVPWSCQGTDLCTP